MAATGDKSRKNEPSFLTKAYLLLYNGMLTVGWTLLLLKTGQYTLTHLHPLEEFAGRVPGLFQEIRWLLLVFQTAAFMEVVHSMFGIVPSAVMTTLMQVYSRIFISWAILEGTPGVDDNLGLLLIAYAWSITEVIRYAYYFFSLLDAVPYIIKWCRYTFFYALYPIGVLGEMMLYFSALPVIQAREQWSLSLPNKFNIAFSFYYFLCFTVLLYIPLFPQLYGHMIQQRKKIIGGAKTKQE